MTDNITIIPQPITPARPKPASRNQQSAPAAENFAQVLSKQIDPPGLKFSKHAVDRMNSRGIQFNPNQMQRLEQAVSQVGTKGGKESLVMIDGTALVVSVKNDTVVTVVGKEQLKNNVFTNIDSAVIA